MKDDSHVLRDNQVRQSNGKYENAIIGSSRSELSRQKLANDNPKAVNISLKISMPSFASIIIRLKKLKNYFFRQVKNKHVMVGGIVACLIVMSVAAYVFFTNSKSDSNTSQDGIKAAQTGTSNGSVTFKPLFPESTSTNKAFKPIYNSERNTVSFVDNYRGASLTISQQKAPLSADIDKIAETAPGIKNTVTTTRGNIIVSTDPISQQQTVVFVNDELLMFIRTPQLLQDTDWIEYISKMQTF